MSQAKIAEQDARGALSLAEHHGRERGRDEGLAEGLRHAVRSLCAAFDIELAADREAALAAMTAPELEVMHEVLLRTRDWR